MSRPHLHDEAEKLIQEWASRGFNGVRFHECRMEEKHDNEDYAIFIAQPDMDLDSLPSHEYLEVDTEGFFSDMEAEMRKRLGDIVIRFHAGCFEWELHREKPVPDEPWDDEFMNEMGGQAVQTDVGNIEWQFGKGVCVSDTGCLFIGHQAFGGIGTKQKMTQLLSLLNLRPHDPLI